MLAQGVHSLPPNARIERDLVFARPGAKELLLDLYLPPPGREKPALVVWIHGGAWRTGSKAEPPMRFLVGRGFALASISYRLSQEAIFPAQLHDCKAAIRWLRAHENDYGYDAARIGVVGASAGGHLAALLGTTGGIAELEGNIGAVGPSSRVNAVVDFFGPTDLLQMSKFPSKLDHDGPDSPESQLIGTPVQQNPAKAERANPIRYITADDPPFLIVHGDQDPLVPLNQSTLLSDALRRAGVPAELRILRGGGHGGTLFTSPDVLDSVSGFLRKHLR
jgi:acetyl esterase/lipase